MTNNNKLYTNIINNVALRIDEMIYISIRNIDLKQGINTLPFDIKTVSTNIARFKYIVYNLVQSILNVSSYKLKTGCIYNTKEVK